MFDNIESQEIKNVPESESDRSVDGCIFNSLNKMPFVLFQPKNSAFLALTSQPQVSSWKLQDPLLGLGVVVSGVVVVAGVVVGLAEGGS